MNPFARVVSWSRQLLFPPAWRIRPPDVTEDMRRALAGLDTGDAAPGEPTGRIDPKTLADALTGIWRFRERTFDPETDRPREITPEASRFFQAGWRTLERARVTVRGHTGEAWVEGRQLDVVHSERSADVTRPTIIDTVKPTIRVDGVTIQNGQVIVAVPENH